VSAAGMSPTRGVPADCTAASSALLLLPQQLSIADRTLLEVPRSREQIVAAVTSPSPASSVGISNRRSQGHIRKKVSDYSLSDDASVSSGATGDTLMGGPCTRGGEYSNSASTKDGGTLTDGRLRGRG